MKYTLQFIDRRSGTVVQTESRKSQQAFDRLWATAIKNINPLKYKLIPRHPAKRRRLPMSDNTIYVKVEVSNPDFNISAKEIQLGLNKLLLACQKPYRVIVTPLDMTQYISREKVEKALGSLFPDTPEAPDNSSDWPTQWFSVAEDGLPELRKGGYYVVRGGDGPMIQIQTTLLPANWQETWNNEITHYCPAPLLPVAKTPEVFRCRDCEKPVAIYPNCNNLGNTTSWYWTCDCGARGGNQPSREAVEKSLERRG